MATQDKPIFFSMKELVEASGVHRQTVHFYLHEGLLPPACEAGGTRNARYGSEHLALLRLIRELRDEQGLSLDAIRRLFERATFDADEIRRQLLGALTSKGTLFNLPAQEPITLGKLAHEAAASTEFIEHLVEAGALAPDPDDAEGRFDRDQIPVLVAAHRLVERGLDETTLERLIRMANAMGALEASSLVCDMTGLGDDTEKLKQCAELRYLDLTELLIAIRRGAIRRMLRRLTEIKPRSRAMVDDVVHAPSTLFIHRHHLDRELLLAQAAAQQESASAMACQRLGRLLFSLGRYSEAELWLSRSAELDPNQAATHSYLGVARGIIGSLVAGIESCRRAVMLQPSSPRAHAFFADALALQSASTTGLDDPTQVLRLACEESLLSRELKAADAREHMEALLAHGRLFTMLPRSITGGANGRRELEEILARTEQTSDEENGFDFPGTNALYRMHALFYLGVNALQEGDRDQAVRWLRESITIDPPSRSAQRAYEMIAGEVG